MKKNLNNANEAMNFSDCNNVKIYSVYLWPGYGYSMDEFRVEAECEEEAFEKVVAQIVNAGKTAYFEEIDSDFINELYNEPWNNRENGAPDGWLYVDATMSGADRPVYINIENAKIIAA